MHVSLCSMDVNPSGQEYATDSFTLSGNLLWASCTGSGIQIAVSGNWLHHSNALCLPVSLFYSQNAVQLLLISTDLIQTAMLRSHPAPLKLLGYSLPWPCPPTLSSQYNFLLHFIPAWSASYLPPIHWIHFFLQNQKELTVRVHKSKESKYFLLAASIRELHSATQYDTH